MCNNEGMSNTHENTTIHSTVTLTDPQTLRPVHYNVDFVKQLTPTERSPWTHQIVMTRPRGRKAYIVDVVVIGDVIVKHTRPRG